MTTGSGAIADRPQVGVLGLGRMGAPVALALSRAYDVVGFDPQPDRLASVVASSRDAVSAGHSAADVTARAEVLLTVLPGTAEFAALADATVDALPAGALWIDLTSNDPRAAEHAEVRAGDRGVLFASAPMAGGPEAARAGTLRFTVSGAETAVARARDLLEPLAAPGGIEVVGRRAGDAPLVKLLGNLLWFGNAVAASEALLLGASLGFDPAHLRGLLARGPGSSVLLERDFAAVHDGDHRPQFGVDRVVEELEILTDLAARNRVPFALSELVAGLHRETLARFGPIDGELLVARLLEERSPSSLRARTDGPDG